MKSIKAKKYYNCSYTGEEIVEQKLYLVEKYNKNGDVLEQMAYDEEEQLLETVVNTFENNQLVKSATSDHAIDLTTVIEYTYDGDKILTKKEFYNDTDFIETRYIYNDEGKAAEIQKVDNEGLEQGKVLFKYDPAENGVTESHFLEDGTLKFELEKYVDEKGNEVEVLQREYFGKEFNEIASEQTYNDDNRVLDKKVYDTKDDLIYHVEHLYTPEGKLEKQIIKDIKHSSQNEILFYKDENDQAMREEYINGSLQLKVALTIDENDNIIEELSRRNIIDDMIELSSKKYEIEYYEEE